MIAALIIVFREVIEAGLVIGIVLAATRAVPRSRLWIAGGIIAGVIGSLIVAGFTSAIASAFEGYGQELFNAAILGTAVVMLTWHNVWMASHGRQIANEMRVAGEDVSAGRRSLAALAIVVGTAVLREGSEIVLFIYGIAVAGGETALGLFSGGVLGLIAGAALTALTYLGLVRIPARHLFAVTSAMIAFLAAGMASQCVAFLQQADVVTLWQDSAWDSSALLSEGGVIGRVLHTLVGYSEQPTYMQLAAYLATLAVIFILMRVFSPRRTLRAKAA